MIALDDHELAPITDAAHRCSLKLGSEFLRAFAAELEQRRNAGTGIFRLIRETQKNFDPPDLTSVPK